MRNASEFILLRILNRKIVAVIAMFIAFTYALLSENAFDLKDMQWAALWFVGGIFVWKKKAWAAVLLAVLSGYELVFYLIPDIKSLGADVVSSKKDFESLSESMIYKLHIIVYLIGGIVESYVLCYGLKDLFLYLKSKMPGQY